MATRVAAFHKLPIEHPPSAAAISKEGNQVAGRLAYQSCSRVVPPFGIALGSLCSLTSFRSLLGFLLASAALQALRAA